MGAAGEDARSIAWLRTPQAIRSRCGAVLELARAGALDHFSVREDRAAPADKDLAATKGRRLSDY